MPPRSRLKLPFIVRRGYASNPSFKFVRELDTLKIDAFRDAHFNSPTPVVFRRQFEQLPAVSKWFYPKSDCSKAVELNKPYLEPHSYAIVPLELTKVKPGADGAEPQTVTFERFEAPLSFFVEYSFRSTGIDRSERIYLAQCSLDSLPAALQADVPTPEIVLKAGKGDIYSTSIWLGHCPTYTPLHRDPNPNVFVQLAGKKVIRLMKPTVGKRVFDRVRVAGRTEAAMSDSIRGEEMMYGEQLDRMDAAVWGEEAQQSGWETTLNSGDGLFIPLGWWHSVKSVGQGINGSVNWWFR